MNLQEIITATQKPELYKPGNAFMWTDPHISKQLLAVHLDPDNDLASRKLPSIETTAAWILNSQQGKGPVDILDLGCGPGLYTERFAQAGNRVNGIDISKNSIVHAQNAAAEKKLDIAYRHASYLEADLGEDRYDLVVLIFTDLGVLLPADRTRLLDKIFRALKQGGTFVFDVLTDRQIEKKTTARTWEASQQGFWRDSPHLALSESFLYKEEKVILYQHTIADTDNRVATYRFWTHFFSQEDVKKMLIAHGFTPVQFRDDLLPDDGLWSGENVLFAIASKHVKTKQ